ncbi:hypothetical protein BKI52_11300 [marine bacterium AO1-C]|nr:hypothetical protein BKI52_11300 [marine bacterium AO1-C]
MKYLTNLLYLLMLCGLFVLASTRVNAQMHGKVTYFNNTNLNIQYLYGSKPKLNQTVTVKRKFKMGRMNGTSSLAEGYVAKVVGKNFLIRVKKYTSTMTQNGVKKPMVKVGNGAVVSWAGMPKKTQRTGGSSASTKLGSFDDAVRLVKKRKYKQAIPILDNLIAKNDKNPYYFYERGYAYLKRYKYQQAAADFTKTIELKPDAQKAYLMRGDAYAGSFRTRERALEDYNYLLKQDLKKSDRIFVFKKIIKVKDRLKDLDGACAGVKRIQSLEGKTRNNQDLFNKYCAGIKMAKKPANRAQVRLISQSEDGYTFTAEILSETEKCYFYKKDNVAFTEDLQQNNYMHIARCRPKYRSSNAVVKVKSKQGKKVILKVMYWTGTMNGKPWIYRYKVGEVISVSW